MIPSSHVVPLLLLSGSSALLLGFIPAPAGASLQQARGVVYHDLDGSGQRDPGEPGLPGVAVSNGRQVVRTSSTGEYVLPIAGDAEIFVIKPRGWMVPMDENGLPRHFYLHRSGGSPRSRFAGVPPTGTLPESIDFALRPNAEPDRFRALLFGDTQPRNLQEVDFIAHDVVDQLIGFDGAFGVTLGDVVFDDLDLFAPLSRVVGRIGLPWFHVLGNHDQNYDAADDAGSDETFTRFFGPPDYAFDWGPVHFIVLDDVFFYRNPEDEPRYRGHLAERTLEFVRNDLALVPEQSLVVVFMHIPLRDVANGRELLRLLSERPHSLSVSAHNHSMEHLFLGPEDGWSAAGRHHHVINVTVCGSWWSGAPDEAGIPHATMADGAPNGYTIVHFDGQEYRLEFRAARRPADHQMAIHAPDAVRADALASVEVLVNVFNGSSRSLVEMRVGQDADWQVLQQVRREDPYFLELKAQEAVLDPLPWRKLPEAGKSAHLWAGRLPAVLAPGTHVLEVRSTDMFGQTNRAHRTLRVLPAASAMAD